MTLLTYRGRVVAPRDFPLWGIGVLYTWTKRSQDMVDRVGQRFTLIHPQDTTLNRGRLVDIGRARPGRPAPIWDFRHVSGTEADSSWGCPATARLVRLMSAPAHLGLVDAVAHDSSDRLDALRASGRPLRAMEILIDTIVAFSRGDWAVDIAAAPLFAGVAVNTTADSLHGAAVWYWIDFPANRDGPDTVVFFLGDVAPHALVPFGGGPITPTDARSVRGTWTNATRVAGVTAAFSHRLGTFRRLEGAPPSAVPADEIPTPPPPRPRVFDPSNIDLFRLSLEGHRLVTGRVRASSDGASVSQLVLIHRGCCPTGSHVIRRVRTGPTRVDTASAQLVDTTGNQVYERFRAAFAELEQQGLVKTPVPSNDALLARPVPGTETILLAFPQHRGLVLRYPIGRPPEYLSKVLGALDSIERRFLPLAGK